jgi:predicted nucleotidyltransferase
MIQNSHRHLSNPQTQVERQLAQAIPNLQLLILFGSQAQGRATLNSDWDLAFLIQNFSYQIGWGELELYHPLGEILGINSDQIDLVNIDKCSPLLGYMIAREGKVLYEAEPDLFLNFQLKAWKRYANTAKLRQYQKDYIHQSLEQLQS